MKEINVPFEEVVVIRNVKTGIDFVGFTDFPDEHQGGSGWMAFYWFEDALSGRVSKMEFNVKGVSIIRRPTYDELMTFATGMFYMAQDRGKKAKLLEQKAKSLHDRLRTNAKNLKNTIQDVVEAASWIDDVAEDYSVL